MHTRSLAQTRLSTRTRAAALLLAAITALNTAGAASLSWDGSDTSAGGAQGGSGTWDANTTANWWDGGANVVWPAAGGSDDDAVFAGTGGNVTLGSAISANDLTFSSTGYVISGTSVLSLINGGTAPVLTTDTGVTATLSAPLTGTGGFTKAGAGTLVLNGANTVSGLVTLGAGTLQVGNGGTTGALGSGDINTGLNTTLAFNRTDSTTAPLVVNNKIYGVNGGAFGTVVVNSGVVQLGGSADNSDTAVDVKNGATLILAKASNGGVHVFGKPSNVRTGGTLQLAGTGNDQIWDSAPITVASGGVFDLNSRSETLSSLTLDGTGFFSSGALVNKTTTATSTLTAPVTLTSGVSIGGPGNITLPGVISGTGTGLTKIGTGTVNLTGSAVNTFTGGVTVNAGTLVLNHNNLGTPTDLVSSSNALTLGGGNLSVSGKSGGTTAQTFAGTSLNGGTSTVFLNRNGGTGTLTLGSITRAAGSVVNFTGNTSLTGTASANEMIKFTAPTSATNGGIGAWAVANNPATVTGRWVAMDASGVVKLVTASTSIGTNWSTITSPSTVYTASASVTLGAAASAQAIQNNNTTASTTITTALGANTLTVNGLSCIQPVTGNVWSFTSSGGGGIVIGAEKDLVLIGAGSFAISAPISNNPGGPSGLTYAGGGTVTLSGVNTYTGQTTVNSGIFQLGTGGSIDSTSGIKVNGGTLLHNLGTPLVPTVTAAGGVVTGNGTINAITVPHLATGTVGNTGSAPLTVGNLTFDGSGTLALNTAATVPLNVTGTLTTNAAGKVAVSLSGLTDWGTNRSYDLISYGAFSGSASDFSTASLPALGGRKTATFTSTGPTNGTIRVTVAGDSALWTGAASSNWTTIASGSPYNWKTFVNGTDTEYASGDDVIFDDSATGSTDIVISDATVTPTSTVFNNSTKNYTVSTPSNFGIGGVTLTKSGNGTVTLNTSNSYTGGTTVTGGRLITTRTMPSGTTLNPIPLSVSSGGTFEYNYDAGDANQGATIFTGNGTIQKTGSSTLVLGGSTSVVALSPGGLIDVQGGTFKAAEFNAEKTVFTNNLGDINIADGASFLGFSTLVRVNKLTGNGTYQSGYFGPRSLTVGVNGGNSTFGGTIQGNGVGGAVGSTPLIKTGNGTFTLTGTINITNLTSDEASGNDVLRVTGGNATSPSVLTLSPAGTSVIGNIDTSNTVTIASAATDVGVLNQTAGTLNTPSLSIGLRGTATYSLSGGTTNTKSITIANDGPTSGSGEGILNVGGNATLNVRNNGRITLGTFYGRKVTVNQTGGTVAFYSDAGTTLGGNGTLAFDSNNNASAYNLYGGTLAIPGISLRSALVNDNGAGGGSGTINFGGGTLKITSSSFTIPTNPAVIRVAPATSVPAKTVALKVLGNGTIANSGANIDTNGFAITLNAPLIHGGNSTIDGGLTKLGGGTLTLTSASAYTGPADITAGSYNGPTTVYEGTLAVSAADFGDSAAVTVASGASLALNFSGTDQVAGLQLGSTVLPAGTYSATTHSTFISGTGTLTVVPLVIPGFAAWASGLGLTGVATGDYDSDSYVDALEYVLGTDPLVADKANITTARVGNDLVVTFDRDDRSETPDIAVTVESGTDLATWPLVYTVGADTATSTAGVTIVENGSAADSVTVTIPMGSDTRRFARVKVTVTP